MTKVLDPEPLLRALHEAGVRHIIIGGFAVNAHGVIRPRPTRRGCDRGELGGIPLRVCGLED